MKTKLIISIVLVMCLCSCEKRKVCNVEDPLTELPWLKKVIDIFEEDAVWFGANPQAKIYQCKYKDGTGFLLEMCVGCPDAGYSFVNCEGKGLCGGGGFAGGDNCSKFKIKDKNKKLIWSKAKN